MKMRAGLLVLISVAMASVAQPQDAATKFGSNHALLIGIDDYEYWPPLGSAVSDVEALEEIFTSQYVFASVQTLTDDAATRPGIITAIRTKLETLDESENLLIYYAGHGQRDPLNKKLAFWVPVEGSYAEEATWISHSSVLDLLESSDIAAKNVVVITDSCYGGALASARGVSALLPKPEEQESYNRIASERSRQVISSGALQPVPDDSAFAKLLRSALRNNEYPVIDLENIYNNLERKLRVFSKGGQKPVMSRFFPNAEEFDIWDDGQFVLVRANQSDDE